MKELPTREFELGAKGFFFFANSFKIQEGTVIGFWINPSEKGERYHYQLQHEVELKNGEKSTRWATVPAEDIFTDKLTAESTFAPIKKERMEEALKNIKTNLEANGVGRDQAVENIADIKEEQERLLVEYKESYGEYVEEVEEETVEEILEKTNE